MSRTLRPLRPLALLVPLLALVAGLLALGTSPAPAAAPHRTKVVVKVADCEGCEVFLQQGLRHSWWSSRVRRVHDGKVVFSVPSHRTRGLSIGITGTWEASTPHPSGFQAIVTLRYRGVAAGAEVTPAVARTKRQGSACYAGTRADRVVFHVEARRQRIAGNGGPALTTLAWASPQTAVLPRTQERVYRGVFGAQDVVPCF
ncbi:hypothetical protein [Pimelobacter simplex]|uniref:hypothetical protein n=1 Tax=Nocardioides simplex TaxID=2045 RepID=UPI003AAE13A5